MSSRLFQKIREEQGKAYSIYSYTSSYKKSGAIGVYAGTTATQGEEVLEMMLEEMRKITKEGVLKDEFLRSKEQLKGNYVLGSESTGSRMNAIGKSMLLFNRVLTEEDVFKRIEAVTHDDIQLLARSVFDMRNMSGAFVGRTTKTKNDWLGMW